MAHDDDPSELLGGLPRTRPQRRSAKRDSPAAPARRREQGAAARGRSARTAPERDAGDIESERAPRPVEPPGRRDVIQTAVQAAGELAQLGLHAGRGVLRSARSRLPGS